MIAAIGTVLFWMTAFAGAILTLVFAFMLMINVVEAVFEILRWFIALVRLPLFICSTILVTPFIIMGWMMDKLPGKRHGDTMTLIQRFQWVTYTGLYRDRGA